MTEINSVGEHPFKNDPRTVIRAHLSQIEAPRQDALDTALSIIHESYQEYQGTRDAFGVCIDLVQKISNPTTVLATLLDLKNSGIPSRWKSNPEITRTVVSICGQLELGLLKAQQIHLAHSGGGETIPDRIDNVTRLVENLQQK